jgi:hypothetical protein
MPRYHVGIDDTDAGSSIGTGALARELLLHLERELGARGEGVTRHQLLIHPEIPYTSHNSAACLVLEAEVTRATLADRCRRFVAFLFHRGADPGLCITDAAEPVEVLSGWGRRAQREVLQRGAALELAAGQGLLLEELGGTGDGVIGALAACALRLTGNDGRFIELEGIRGLKGTLTVGEILAQSAVTAVVEQGGGPLPAECGVETNGWVRPSLQGGRAVLEVRRNGDGFRIDRHRPRGEKNK